MRRSLMIVMVVGVVACGGGKKDAEEPSGGGGGGGGDWDPAERDNPCGGGTMVSMECIDETRNAFNTKRGQISRCYADAVEDGKLNKKAGGRINVVVTIAPSGKATAVEIDDSSTLKSPDVEGCIVDAIKSWDLPKPNVRFEFTFGYDFLPDA